MKSSGQIIRLSVVDSTNIYTSQKLGHSDMRHGTMVLAESQTKGKGQRGKSWESAFGKNLLSSVFLEHSDLQPEDQFLISIAASLAVVDTLEHFGIEGAIKWPNDILVGNRKIAGLLIENQVTQRSIESSIVGLGLNVNQVEFSAFHWPATSMSLEVGKVFDLEEVAYQWYRKLISRMNTRRDRRSELHSSYNRLLAFAGEVMTFIHNGQRLEGKLIGVLASGSIVIERDGRPAQFDRGEISFRRSDSAPPHRYS